MSTDRAENTNASYPDSGPVRDSKEGGLDELEEVEDGIGDEVRNCNAGEHLFPSILARYLATIQEVPLGGDSFGDIKSSWTWYPHCPGQKHH